MTRTVPCACGATVTADPSDPMPGVASHNAGTAHRAWRRRVMAVGRTREWRSALRADLERVRADRRRLAWEEAA